MIMGILSPSKIFTKHGEKTFFNITTLKIIRIVTAKMYLSMYIIINPIISFQQLRFILRPFDSSKFKSVTAKNYLLTLPVLATVYYKSEYFVFINV